MRFMVIGGVTQHNQSFESLKIPCVSIGEELRDLGHSLLICSPFKDSADYWVLKGFINNTKAQSVEIHYVDIEIVHNEIQNLEAEYKSCRFIKIPHTPPNDSNEESLAYSWLLCQLYAFESCQSIVAIGGKDNGVANMLLLLADARRKPVIPFTFLGGAASQAFLRRRYEIEDNIGDKYTLLHGEESVREALRLSEKIQERQIKNFLDENNPKVFISYSRKRPFEADYIETILRRRNIQVFRDENDFGAGHAIPIEINEAIHAANIFIAIWCAEYACSPWCFDELEIALDRNDIGKMELWIFCIDDTRIVPKRARGLNVFNVKTREEIEGQILKLLERAKG